MSKDSRGRNREFRLVLSSRMMWIGALIVEYKVRLWDNSVRVSDEVDGLHHRMKTDETDAEAE